jgi:hypothetical protein
MRFKFFGGMGFSEDTPMEALGEMLRIAPKYL